MIALVLPRSYQSAATLWALQRYKVIGATGPDMDSVSTPAQSQAAALSELLRTRTFVLSVAHATKLAAALHLNPGSQNAQARDDALFKEISTAVQVTALGYNLLVITYTNQDPHVAQQVVAAVIQNYAAQSEKFSTAEAQSLLNNFRMQLANAKDNEDVATAAEAHYLSTHPALANLTQSQLLTDPQYAMLDAQRLQAQTTVQNIQTTIDTIYQEIAAQGSSNSLFRVQDAPVVPDQPVSHMGLLLIAGGIGLGIALLACTLYILILVRRDHAVYSIIDLQKVTSLPIVMRLPHLESTTMLALSEPPQMIELIEEDTIFYRKRL
jgi:uncharacterized protein involved in exopolysaccharide biosynthesis